MKKKIEIILLGGTIASTLDENGKEIVMDLSEYIKTFYEMNEIADISVNSFKQLSGYNTQTIDLIDTANEIKRVISENHVDGIVVVMGTNLMEEFSFGIQVLIDTDIPIVFTGAMRTPSMKSADGAGNLLASLRVAASNACRNCGVLVVMDDTIHSADYVKKMHPQNTSTFKSEFPLGYVAEGIPSLRVRPVLRKHPWLNIKKEPVDVLLYTSYMADSGKILSKVNELDYAGLVVEGQGAGFCAEWVFDYIVEIHKKIPVVFSTRIGNGEPLTLSYGNGYGMPSYLVEHGYLNSNQLDSRKARILLMLLIMSNCTKEQMQQSFNMYSKYYLQ